MQKKHLKFAAMFGTAVLLTMLASALFQPWRTAILETAAVALIALAPALSQFNARQTMKENNHA